MVMEQAPTKTKPKLTDRPPRTRSGGNGRVESFPNRPIAQQAAVRCCALC